FDGKPFARGERAGERVVNVHAVHRLVGGRERVVLEGDDARVDAMVDTGADLDRKAVETDFGQAALDDVVVVGLKAGEGGDDVVLAGVVTLDEVVGRLDLVEVAFAEIANDLGIGPIVELAEDGDAFAD